MRSASVDFALFPVFGAMAEAAGSAEALVATAATGGGALLSFGLGSGGERRSFRRKELQVAKVGERPCFLCL